ncbi:MAG: serine protease [Planctomycetota bacterium]|nr:MAG: serine protease [Planctomycetota bacterium]
MITPQSDSDKLLFSTVRIVTEKPNSKVGIGTGFFFEFKTKSGQFVPTLITNKHVVKDAIVGRFRLHEQKKVGDSDIPTGKYIDLQFKDFESQWIMHPSTNIDLCAMPIGPLVNEAQKQSRDFYRSTLTAEHIPAPGTLQNLKAIEDIFMYGYPIGLWDEVNNLPLIRRGITSTHPAVDFCGKNEGMIDAACFPGSSGSPVLIINEGQYTTASNQMVVGQSRIILLGVLYAGPVLKKDGNTESRPIPTNVKEEEKDVAERLHLGYYVSSSEIHKLGDEIKDKYQLD